MKRSDLVQSLMRRTKLPKKRVEQALRLMFVALVARLAAGKRLEIRGFGTLSTRLTRARRGRNPRSGAAVAVAAKRLPTFRISKKFRAQLNDGAPPVG